MTNEFENWDNTCERYVAFLDIMGFRERVFREDHSRVKSMLESLRPTIEVIEEKAKSRLDKKPIVDDSQSTASSFIYPVSFSDSIIFISSDSTFSSARKILYNVRWILAEALNAEIPMKGAIAYGRLTANLKKSLYFGKPLIDAYDLQQELFLYGAILHHTMEKHLKDNDMIEKLNDNYIYKWSVPLKTGKINHYIVDWTDMVHKEESQVCVNKLYNRVSGKPRMYVDNTLKFLKWLSEEKVTIH
jgi:hypothetical protein